MEELFGDSCVLELEPLHYAPGVDNRHRYLYVLIPSFSLCITDALLGLRSGAAHCDDIVPVSKYDVFVGIHWSIPDGFIYWRSVLLVYGAIVVQEVAYG